MKGWMYILQCIDGSFYVGSTTDLEKTITEHQEGRGCEYTQNRLPVQLAYSEEFPQSEQAVYREKLVQGWCQSRKEALVRDGKEGKNTQTVFRNKSRRRSSENLMAED